jgi:hypothetical protein
MKQQTRLLLLHKGFFMTGLDCIDYSGEVNRFRGRGEDLTIYFLRAANLAAKSSYEGGAEVGGFGFDGEMGGFGSNGGGGLGLIC